MCRAIWARCEISLAAFFVSNKSQDKLTIQNNHKEKPESEGKANTALQHGISGKERNNPCSLGFDNLQPLFDSKIEEGKIVETHAKKVVDYIA